MPKIHFSCTACGQRYTVGAKVAGKKVKCQRCQTILRIPAVESDSPKMAKRQSVPTEDAGPGTVSHKAKPPSLYKLSEETPSTPKKNPPDTDDGEEELRKQSHKAERSRRTSSGQRAAAWKKVRLGLLLLVVGTTMLIVPIVLSTAGSFMSSIRHWTAFISLPLFLGAFPLQLIGFGLLTFVPCRLPRRLAIGVLGTNLAAVALAFAMVVYLGFFVVSHGTRVRVRPHTPGTVGRAIEDGGVIIAWTDGPVGKRKVKQIEILDGSKRETYESLDQVPAQYRGEVESLIERSEKNKKRFEEEMSQRTKRINEDVGQGELRPDAAVKKLDKPLQDVPSPKLADLQDPTVTLIPFLRRMVVLLAVLLLVVAANYLLFPFFLRSLAEAVHAAGLADTYMKLYGIVLGVFMVGLLCCLLPFIPLPVRFIMFVWMFIMTPLGTISTLSFLVMHVVYIKLLLDLRVAISDRLGG